MLEATGSHQPLIHPITYSLTSFKWDESPPPPPHHPRPHWPSGSRPQREPEGLVFSGALRLRLLHNTGRGKEQRDVWKTQRALRAESCNTHAVPAGGYATHNHTRTHSAASSASGQIGMHGWSVGGEGTSYFTACSSGGVMEKPLMCGDDENSAEVLFNRSSFVTAGAPEHSCTPPTPLLHTRIHSKSNNCTGETVFLICFLQRVKLYVHKGFQRIVFNIFRSEQTC